MSKILLVCGVLFLSAGYLAQTGPGIGLYATGTETGFGFRSGKETRLILDARLAKAAIYSEKNKASSFTSEVSAVYKVVKSEKVRFHLGIGYRGEWNLNAVNKHGIVIPVGAEAFPFPFQNAGLFFEAAPFFVSDEYSSSYYGIRTSAGFVFYFLRKPKPTTLSR